MRPVPSRSGPASPTRARVTVVIPCFNDGSFVSEAVASVQESEPVDVIVVDDGSNDGSTHEVLAKLEASGATRVIYQENAGVSAARMTGVEAARTPYIFPLDSDDRIEPGCLAPLADLLDADPSVAIAYGDGVFLDEGVGWTARPWDPFTLLYMNSWGPSCLTRREVIFAVGGWVQPQCYSDWDFLLALAEHGYAGAAIDHVVLHYRRHTTARKHTNCLKNHGEHYRRLQRRHAALFARRRELAKQSPLPRWSRFWFPIRHGSRPLFPFPAYWWLRGRYSLRPRT